MLRIFSTILVGTYTYAAAPQVVTIGDSIFVNPVNPNNVPAQFSTANPSWTVINLNVNAETADGTLTNYNSPTGGKFRSNPAASENLVVIETGSNNLTTDTAIQVLAKIDLIYLAVVARGQYPLVCKIIPRGDLNGANETKRQAINTGLDTAYPGHIIDPTVDPVFANQAATANTTYYNGDTIHLVTAGATKYLSYFSTAVLGVKSTGAKVGTMAGQDADSVAIRGGTIDGLTYTKAGYYRANSEAFAAYATEGFRFTDAAGNQSGGMVEISNSGIEFVVFYTSSASNNFTWRDVAGNERMYLDSSGKLGPNSLVVARHVTPAGTTGAQTINLQEGTVNFAAAASSLVVTNSLITTASSILVGIQTNDTTAVIKNVVPANGSFTIRMSVNPTAETAVAFHVMN